MRMSSRMSSPMSAIGAVALCALGLTGLAAATPGTGRPDPLPARAAEAAPAGACTPAAWPYASACGTEARARTVRVIAVDAMSALPVRR